MNTIKKRVRKPKTKDPEIYVIRALKEKPPEEWEADIARLPAEVRAQVARVIWWDWFAGREVANRWAHLDAYLRPRSVADLRLQLAANWDRKRMADAEFGRDLSKREMADCLVRCGYPPNYAVKRA